MHYLDHAATTPVSREAADIMAAVLTEGFGKGLTLNVNAYGKASLNNAYNRGQEQSSVLAARDVDLEKFYSFVRRDIFRCEGVNH